MHNLVSSVLNSKLGISLSPQKRAPSESGMSMRSMRSNISGIQQIRQVELNEKKKKEEAQRKKLADMEAEYALLASGKKSRFSR